MPRLAASLCAHKRLPRPPNADRTSGSTFWGSLPSARLSSTSAGERNAKRGNASICGHRENSTHLCIRGGANNKGYPPPQQPLRPFASRSHLALEVPVERGGAPLKVFVQPPQPKRAPFADAKRHQRLPPRLGRRRPQPPVCVSEPRQVRAGEELANVSRRLACFCFVAYRCRGEQDVERRPPLGRRPEQLHDLLDRAQRGLPLLHLHSCKAPTKRARKRRAGKNVIMERRFWSHPSAGVLLSLASLA